MGMDMGMDMDTSSMPGMSMVFTNNHDTPLFSSQWTPRSPGQFAGTCIFLIVLAIFHRCLSAARRTLELRWHDTAVKRRYIRVAGESLGGADGEAHHHSAHHAAAEKSEEAILTTRGLDENVRVLRTSRQGMQAAPWRLSTDLPRACIFTVQSGVSYLLMLAVMTYEVGYFLSVLAGLFIGELAIGRFAIMEDGHH